MMESFNSWIRRFNFVLNSMRPLSHRFWMKKAIEHYNANLKLMPDFYRLVKRGTPRTTVNTRSPRKVNKRHLKRPASKKRPAAANSR